MAQKGGENMAWEVDLSKKVGEISYLGISGTRVITYGIYNSNGYMAVYRIKTLHDGTVVDIPILQIVNEDHLRNYLGLSPGYENLRKKSNDIVKLKIARECKNYWRIQQIFREALPDLEVEIVDSMERG